MSVVGVICQMYKFFFYSFTCIDTFAGATLIVSPIFFGTFKGIVKNFLINNSYPLPYTVDDTNLIMSIDVNGNQFLRIYEKY